MYPTQQLLGGAVPASLLLTLAIVIALGVFLRALWLRVLQPLRRARPQLRFDRWPQRLQAFLLYVIGQRKVFDDPYAGVLHALVFWGFLIWQPFTFNLLLEGYGDQLTLAALLGPLWRGYTLLVELASVGVLVGCGLALYRRTVLRPALLVNTRDAFLILGLIAGLMLTYFVSEAVHLAAVGGAGDPAMPISSALSGALTGLPSDTLTVAFGGLWVFHVALFLGFLMYIPYSKHLHLIAAPFTVLFRSLDARGTLQAIPNIEQQQHFGVGSIEDLGWKQLLDLDACTECGRCTAACPAYATDKPLSPRDLILDLKAVSHGELPLHQRESLAGRAEFAALGGELPLVSGVVHEETLWACVTCGACMEACPVFIEHVPTIVDMRRHLVLEQGKLPEAAESALVSLERRGHPWRGTTHNRTDWMQGLDIPQFTSGDELEYLYWVGCSGALEDRNRNVTLAVIKVLKAAGVRFGVLGGQESCTGDPARRLGNEYLYQTLAQQNIQLFQTLSVKKIITQCPHCFNTFKNEYTQFDGNYEVIHHSELVAELLKSGRLQLKKPLPETITYHDSCYLGRHNEVYDAPRAIASALPGATVVEMAQHGPKSFCCGAGGGHMFMEEKTAKRINWQRTDMALATGASVVATACPFCVIMLEDGIRGRNAEDKLRARDLAELVADALGD